MTVNLMERRWERSDRVPLGYSSPAGGAKKERPRKAWFSLFIKILLYLPEMAMISASKYQNSHICLCIVIFLNAIFIHHNIKI